MKKIGIVGGTAWLSTVDYYTAICRMSEQFHAAQNRKGPLPTPEMSIESLAVCRREASASLGV